MPPRWITQEEWLRTGGAPEQSGHVPAEQSREAVGVRPSSPQEELRGAVEGARKRKRSRKRFRIVTAALTFGILATMFYAVEVDQPLKEFKAPPRMFQPETATETIGRAAAGRAVSDPMPETAPGQTTPGPDPMPETAPGQTTPIPDPMPEIATDQITPVPDAMLNTQQNVHRNPHHGNKTHGKR